jgi:hypothetical protein
MVEGTKHCITLNWLVWTHIYGAYQDICSKVKDKLLHLVTSTGKIEGQCYWAALNFGGNNSLFGWATLAHLPNEPNSCSS